jgi:rfaE bifunctional protein nucleotidyltransferase chain/domain
MSSERKIVSLAALKGRVARHRREGKKAAFTNGCFDILHRGHVSYLEAAKKKDRILIVGLNSDASIQRIKGPKRPIIGQKERAAVIAALECVDYVVFFGEDTPYHLIKAIKPDILIKGADWKGKDVVGSDVVKKNGGRIELIKYLTQYSTTKIIETIQQKCAA